MSIYNLKQGGCHTKNKRDIFQPKVWIVPDMLPISPPILQKMRLALLVSIPLALLTSSEVLTCAHRADMSLDILEKCHEMPTCSSENSPLVGTECLESSLQDADTGKLQGVWGKTNWKTSWKLYPCKQEVRSTGSTLTDDSYSTRAAFVCCKACDIVAEDAFSVASQHSIGLIDIKIIKWGTFMSQRRFVTWYVRKIRTCSSENSPLVGTECLESSLQDRGCRTSYCQALDLCIQEIFLQSNLHCHLVKPQLFAVAQTDLLSSLEPNQCCYPECHFKKGTQKGVFFRNIY